jgi:hypothetical protein
MKLATFIPMDTATLRVSKAANIAEDTTFFSLENRDGQSTNQKFLDLYHEVAEVSLQKNIPVADTTDKLNQDLMMAGVINENIHAESFTSKEKLNIEYRVNNLELGGSLDDQLNLNMKETKRNLDIENIIPKQTASNEEFSNRSNGIETTLIKKSALDLTTPTSLTDIYVRKANVGKEAQINFHEKITMSTLEGLRSENSLSVLKQPGKLDPIGVASTTFGKPSVAIAAISMSEYTSQISVLPSIVPHEISSVIARSMPELAGERIDVHNTTISDTANVRSIKSIELQLVPRSLGVIEVKLTRNNGQMNIMIRTQTAEAENLLRGETRALQDLVRSTGVLVDDIKVMIIQQSDLEQGEQRLEKNNESSFKQFDKNEEQKSPAEHPTPKISGDDSILKSNNQNAKDATSRSGWYF